MDLISIAALILSVLATSGTMAYNAVQSKKSRQAAAALQEDAQAHEELMQERQMQYNSYPNQVSMMKEAGINPALMYGMSGGSLQAVSAGSTGSGALASSPQAIPMHEPSENAIQAAMSIMATKANIAQSEALTQKAMAELPFIDAQTKESLKRAGLYAIQQRGLSLDNAMKFTDLRYRDTMNQLDILAKLAGIDNVSALTRKYISDAELNDLQSRYTQVEINQAAFQYDKDRTIWTECQDYIIAGMKAENEGKMSEANRLYAEAAIAMDRANVIQDTHIDPNSKYGIVGVMSHILAKGVDNKIQFMKDAGNKFLNVFDTQVLPKVKSIGPAVSSFGKMVYEQGRKNNTFRTPREIWNQDVLRGKE